MGAVAKKKRNVKRKQETYGKREVLSREQFAFAFHAILTVCHSKQVHEMNKNLTKEIKASRQRYQRWTLVRKEEEEEEGVESFCSLFLVA